MRSVTFLCATTPACESRFTSIDAKAIPIEYQNFLMTKVFAHVHDVHFQNPMESRHKEYCTLRQITCVDDVVERIIYIGHKAGDFDVSHLPSTLTYLSLLSCAQRFRIETRLLPRKLQIAKLGWNQICGTLDLTCLPSGVKEFLIEENKISGRIDCTQLPPCLERLDVSANRLRQGVVYYGNLPHTLVQVTIEAVHGSNKIGEYVATDESEKLWREAFKRAIH